MLRHPERIQIEAPPEPSEIRAILAGLRDGLIIVIIARIVVLILEVLSQ